MTAIAERLSAPPALQRRPRVAMKWKLLGAFAGAFSIVFGFIAVWVIHDAGAKVRDRLVTELNNTAVGAARSLDADMFAELLATVPAVPDPSNPAGLGYPDSEAYVALARQLYSIKDIVPEANPYTYYMAPEDGKLYFAVSSGYFYTPQFGVMYKEPVANVADPETYQRMAAGLTNTTDEPPYTDEYGSWVSVYSPILDRSGKVVGAIGIDYSLAYVATVQKDVQRNMFVVLGGSYVALLLLVLVLSSTLVRPLARLTAATRRIADGEYDLDVRSIVKSRFPDEMYELGQSFAIMAEKVAARERHLTKEVQRLRVEIDQAKREEAVQEITSTDFFEDLSGKADQLRAALRRKETP